jgi:WD40-like Beta Propeller Repeat
VNAREAKQLLERVELPDEAAARERAWRVVDAAFGERPRRPPRGRRLRAALAIAAAVVILAVALSPAGAAVGDWIRDAVRPGSRDAHPALDSLPAPGRLLVTSPGGVWVVSSDGSRRRLGDYREADWSASGRFVVATRGRQVVAVQPQDGQVRWALARPERVSHPSWAPGDGFRIAYLSAGSVRVVAGDGTGDRRLAPSVAPVTPAWRPGARHLVTYADRLGRLSLVDVDAERRLWRTRPDTAPIALAWTTDGRRLVALAPDSLRLLAADGRTLARAGLGPDARPEALALDPAGRSAAVAVRDRAGRSEVDAFALRHGLRAPQRLFAGQGRFTGLAWSPDGRWLLVAWREADQWLFVRSSSVRKLAAVSNIRRQFAPGGGVAPFPRIAGWCCSD